MYCPSCGAKVNEDPAPKFCSACGAALSGGGASAKSGNGKKTAVAVALLVVFLGAAICLGVAFREPVKGFVQKHFKKEPVSVSESASAAKPSETAAPQTKAPETTAKAPEPQKKYAPGTYVNSNSTVVNLRAEHSAESPLKGLLAAGETVRVLEVYEAPGAEAKLRWWGRAEVNGETCWAALYYLTCAEVSGERHARDELNRLWKKLEGCWNTDDSAMFSMFSVNGSELRYLYAPWYSEVSVSALVEGGFTGSPAGVIRVHLYAPAYESEGYGAPEVDCDLLLDVSELENGRVAWNLGDGWESGGYAGRDMDEARPELP